MLPLAETRKAHVVVTHQGCDNGAAQKSWKLPMYHHGGYSVWSWDFFFKFLRIYIITISLAVEEDEEF